jgi:micrococcal nuclease
VIDGVTISVRLGGRDEIVRYLGLAPPNPGSESGDLATFVNRSWVEKVQVLLERDVTDVDSEGRLLRYVWVEDAMVNAALLGYGLARHRPRPPDVRYAEAFDRIESEARREGLGIWTDSAGEVAGAERRTAPLSVRSR